MDSLFIIQSQASIKTPVPITRHKNFVTLLEANMAQFKVE